MDIMESAQKVRKRGLEFIVDNWKGMAVATGVIALGLEAKEIASYVAEVAKFVWNEPVATWASVATVGLGAGYVLHVRRKDSDANPLYQEAKERFESSRDYLGRQAALEALKSAAKAGHKEAKVVYNQYKGAIRIYKRPAVSDDILQQAKESLGVLSGRINTRYDTDIINKVQYARKLVGEGNDVATGNADRITKYNRAKELLQQAVDARSNKYVSAQRELSTVKRKIEVLMRRV